jgi:hypothetical protein
VHEPRRRDDPVPAGGCGVVGVDDHEPIGPAPGDLLGGSKGEVRERAPRGMEVEAVRRVRDGRPLGWRDAPNGIPRHERRDGRVDMDDVE